MFGFSIKTLERGFLPVMVRVVSAVIFLEPSYKVVFCKFGKQITVGL